MKIRFDAVHAHILWPPHQLQRLYRRIAFNFSLLPETEQMAANFLICMEATI